MSDVVFTFFSNITVLNLKQMFIFVIKQRKKRTMKSIFEIYKIDNKKCGIFARSKLSLK